MPKIDDRNGSELKLRNIFKLPVVQHCGEHGSNGWGRRLFLVLMFIDSNLALDILQKCSCVTLEAALCDNACISYYYKVLMRYQTTNRSYTDENPFLIYYYSVGVRLWADCY